MMKFKKQFRICTLLMCIAFQAFHVYAQSDFQCHTGSVKAIFNSESANLGVLADPPCWPKEILPCEKTVDYSKTRTTSYKIY